MDWSAMLVQIKKVLAVKLFSVGETQVLVSSVLLALLILLTSLVLSRLAKKSIDRMLRRSVGGNISGGVIQRLTGYVIVIAGIVASLQAIGIDLSTLFAAGAVFAVGLGFAMQNIAQNFVSGIILLVEGSIKRGDVLEVENEVVKVVKMGIRATLTRTRNEEELIIPNSILVQGMVKNYTLSDSFFLLKCTVGVVYGSDMKLVKEVLERTAEQLPFAVDAQKTRVMMSGFGDSSVNFDVYVWIGDPWLARQYRSRVNEAIWWALKEAHVVIAFPQLDIHFDPPVEQALVSRALQP